MFRGYNLDFKPEEDETFNKFHAIGRKISIADKGQIINTINSFKSPDGTLDGTKLRANWFPSIDAQVFISHSHDDEKRAVFLAGWLYENFKIKAFIDSCVWGYADNLLRLIDKKYCETSPELFNYTLRNYSTSHVHMMLSTALGSMIDKTECLFFLNTPFSILPSDVINKTVSPWIYSEISMTQLIRQRSPEDHRPKLYKSKHFSADGKKANLLEKAELTFTYDVDLSHLTDINIDVLNKWCEDDKKVNFPLDRLYELT
ncbi:MAG: hypothetical protein ACLQQ4_04680 [Bacteroidia bacterium]